MNKLLRANSLFLKGKHREAMDAYMDIIRVYPNAIAGSNIGYMYHRGIGAPRNYKLARDYYNAVADMDGGVAYFNLALMYMRGQGVEVDFKKAISFMKASALCGCADANLYLGLAYIMGYAYDPVEIECLSLIPFYRVIYRDNSVPRIDGAGCYDPTIEDKRYGVIDADGNEAAQMYQSLIEQHDCNPYTEKQCGAAKFMLGKMCIEGVGDYYNPKLGYRKIYNAAICHDSAEAARFLLDNRSLARTYKINVDKIELLASKGYFRPIMGNLGTPTSHRVPLILEEKL